MVPERCSGQCERHDGGGKYDAFQEESQDEGEEITAGATEEINEIVEVAIDSGAGRNVWPKSRKAPGKLEEVKRWVKLVAANGTPSEVFGEKTIEFE
eukprot:9319691-Lingulodinium_polyedra.AAC.1